MTTDKDNNVWNIKTKKRALPPVPNGRVSQLHCDLEKVVMRNVNARGDVALLARTVIQLLNSIDLIAVTAELSAIDAGVLGRQDHPLSVIVEICHDVLNTNVQPPTGGV